MLAFLRNTLALAAVAFATHAAAQITFYEHDNYQGRSFTAERDVEDFGRFGFNDKASSVDVRGERWEICEDIRFGGRCIVLRQGQYPNLSSFGFNDRASSARPVGRDERASDNRYGPPPVAQVNTRPGPVITFYEHDGFQGRSFTTDRDIGDFSRVGFNDRASSVEVRGERWEVCEDARFGGRCLILRPGRYANLSSMGMNDRISSVRAISRDFRVEDNRYAPAYAPDYRRRPEEQLFQANVISVRAVVSNAQQRCWVEREQIGQDRTSANVPGAIAGAVIGGILGHQVGGGSGRDAATAVGVIGGAAIGANVGQPTYTQDVQRCDRPVAQARPDYWDVAYVFRGQEYHVQMTSPPGPTLVVNASGEPRV